MAVSFKTRRLPRRDDVAMEPHLDLLTLGVPDLEAARRFYLDGLGWKAAMDVPGEVVFIQIGHGLLLGLFGADDLEADVDPARAKPEQPTRAHAVPPPISLAQILSTEDEVVETVRRAERAGATILKEPQHAAFGGFHAYFADPCGFRWEIATNPGWSVDPDGTVHIGPIQAS
jgi:catechol 2,3-dioxygenase-like lactoylglutathione lyase family enzyme